MIFKLHNFCTSATKVLSEISFGFDQLVHEETVKYKLSTRFNKPKLLVMFNFLMGAMFGDQLLFLHLHEHNNY